MPAKHTLLSTALAFFPLIHSGCKIVIITPADGGQVNDQTKAVVWPIDSRCVIDVSNTDFDKTLVPVPDRWHDFSHWRKADGYFCGGSAQDCHLFTTTLDDSIESVMAILASDEEFYLEPVFVRRSLPRPSLWIALPALRAGRAGGAFAVTQNDFNGDGYTDIFVAPARWKSYERSPVELYLNDGNDQFYQDESLFDNSKDGGQHPRKAVSADCVFR